MEAVLLIISTVILALICYLVVVWFERKTAYLKEPQVAPSRKTEELAKRDFPEQAFLMLYGTIMGVLVGVFGNLFATLYFEHIVKKDASLALPFLGVSIFLVLMLTVLFALMFIYFKKAKT